MKPKQPKAHHIALFQQASAFYQNGQLPEAAAQYKKILVDFPNDPQILSTVGTLALQLGNLSEAINYLEKSIKILPQQAEILCNLGVSLAYANRLDEAVRQYDKALALKPEYAEAYNNRGIALNSLQKSQAAIADYDKAIALQPNYAEAYINRGTALQQLKQFNQAIASFDQAIAIKPDYPQAYNNRGIALQALKNYQAALASYQQAIALHPNYAEAYSNQGYTLRALKQYQEALRSCLQAIGLNPQYVEAYNNLGIILDDLKHFDAALISYETALSLKADFAEALINRGNTLKQLRRLDESLESIDKGIALSPSSAKAHNIRGATLHELRRFQEAMDSYREAIELQADYAEAYKNLGITLKRLNENEQALASFEQAIAIDPAYSEAYSNRGNVLNNTLRLSEALDNYDKAIALDPEYSGAYWNKALLKLQTGDFAEGWRLYEWRWRDQLQAQKREFTQALWLGEEPVKDKTLFVYPEQGIGDFIQFCRYVTLLQASGAKLIVEAPSALLSLLGSLPGEFILTAPGQDLPAFDLHCPIMSLPLAFRTTLADIPASIPYLYADTAKQQVWRKRLGDKTKIRVGLAWSGALEHSNDHNRSIALKLLEPLLSLPVEFHCLQKDIRPDDALTLADFKQIHQHQTELNDFSDTAALVDAMDLIISVDTALAHLAGAMAKPVWILLPYVPDFRWLLNRSDSPWYPTAKLFRQPAIGNWHGLVAEVTEKLAESSSLIDDETEKNAIGQAHQPV